MSDHAFTSFDDLRLRGDTSESSMSLSWILITVVVGAYILVYAAQNLGYPVWRWTRQLLDMAAGLLHLSPVPLGSSDAVASEDTMQRAGGLLNSLIGLSSDSLLQKGVKTFTSALSSGPSTAPPGLGNISNSCYQNSVIQGLSALPSLRHYLSNVTTDYPSLGLETTNGALHDLITKLNDPVNTGQNFWIRGKLKSMTTFTQQDAQEYYSKILDEMDNEVKKVSSSKRRSYVSWLETTRTLGDSYVVAEDAKSQRYEDNAQQQPSRNKQIKIAPNPLDGLIAQRVGCTSCGYSEGLSLINFNCITVSLGLNRGYDIRECLDEYTKLEYIDGVECAKCTLLKLQKTLAPLAAATPDSPYAARLHAVTKLLEEEKFDDNALVKNLNIAKKNWVQSSKSKQIVVARAPKSLVLHVNRSIFDEMTGAQYKNSAAVSYPRILDLGNWCLGGLPSDSQQPDMPLEEWPRDPKQSMLQAADEAMTTSPFQYTLRAAVTHFGSHGNGHYVCYRPHARIVTESDMASEDDDLANLHEEAWWRFSDDTVYSVPEEQAHQGNVFMLFYERLDVSTQSQPKGESQTASVHFIAEDAPFPPADVECSKLLQDTKDAAVYVPLPDDDTADDIVSSSFLVADDDAPQVPHDDTIRQRVPASEDVPSEQIRSLSPSTDVEIATSEADSEDAPSTQLTSDSEAERWSPPTPKPMMSIPPHAMRTAGNTGSRGKNSRRSLPLVSAT